MHAAETVLEDSGALPLEMDVSKMNTGDIIDVYVHKGEAINNKTGDQVATFALKVRQIPLPSFPPRHISPPLTLQTDVILDEVRAGGRIPLIIGRGLTGTNTHTLKSYTASSAPRG